jgi:DNA-binding transcriptional ArsR family regulator
MGNQVTADAEDAVAPPRPAAAGPAAMTAATPTATATATAAAAAAAAAAVSGVARAVDASDRIFDALGEPIRRRILELLREGPVAVGVLAAQLPVGRPAVSKHLRLLSGAGLVEHRSVGTKNLYALAPLGLVEAHRWLVAIWGIDLSSPSYADSVADRADSGGRSTRAASTGKRGPTRKVRDSMSAPASGRPQP